MTEPESGETRPVPIQGRDIMVRELTGAQRLLASREVRNIMRSDLDRVARVKALGRTFDLVEAMVVNPEDVEYLETLIMERKMDIEDFRPILSAFSDVALEEEEPVKPRVRRGRPPKRT